MDMTTIGTVPDRFQSYNIEMVEVMGGRFWKPYGDRIPQSGYSRRQFSVTPAGVDPDIFEYRPPIDLTDRRLRVLAKALGPTYVRVSGTWANTVYFAESDTEAAQEPPTGFGGVLTAGQWKGVIDFAQAVDAELISSFSIGPGVRDADGIWTLNQGRRWLSYTGSVGGNLAAVEFMNEPTYAVMGGAPDSYDASAYGRDIAIFEPFLRQRSPDTLFIGPGSVGEGLAQPLALGRSRTLGTEDLLRSTDHRVDAFSYHFYGAVSQRGARIGAGAQTTPVAAMSRD
jgi:heparanase 1